MATFYVMTARGRTDVELHGSGPEYDKLENQLSRKRDRTGITQSSIQEILSGSMQTLPVSPAAGFMAEFGPTVSEWQLQRSSYQGSNPNNWRMEPNIFQGSGRFVMDLLYEHFLGDNPSEFSHMNVYIPTETSQWPWLNVNMVYRDHHYGRAYGHHLGRCQSDDYLLISSCSLFR